MRESFVRQIKNRALLLQQDGFGIDVPNGWLQLPATVDGERIIALSIGARSDCDAVVVETADYKGVNALVCAVGCPLIGPFNPPITIRPYYTLDPTFTTAIAGYRAEIYAWTHLPRGFATTRAPQLYAAPLTPFLGGAKNLFGGNDNVFLWTMGRARARIAVFNNTAGVANISVFGYFQLMPTIVEPLNVRRQSASTGPTDFAGFEDTAYVAPFAVGGTSFRWVDVALIGGPTAISISSDVNSEDVIAHCYIQGEVGNG
jgi:hypothetical protein